MGEVLRKFGRYFLLDHLAQGGMAEIYRARMASIDGGGRIIVIKKIQSGFGGNKEFLQMFKSEIKVTMGFNHPNIVQLYDFGEENNQPYIAMELVDGKNLRQFITRFGELKQPFPIELATYIAEQAASGLYYAHSYRDKFSGAALNIVHRDISPQNILISFEGNVKVIDFGIAKATINSESTRAGVIKGKPSYLSPEQINGETLDGRSDIFALGAVFWESLTGKKLFAGENDLAVLKLIESCQTSVKPPSALNPQVPKDLDFIVLKALAKQREKRYQTAEELQRALHKFLYNYQPDFNPSDLAYYAKDLFKNEILEDRKKIQKLNEKAEKLLASNQTPIQESPQIEPAENNKEKSFSQEEDATIVDSKSKLSSSPDLQGKPVPIKSQQHGHEKMGIDPTNPTMTYSRDSALGKSALPNTSGIHSQRINVSDSRKIGRPAENFEKEKSSQLNLIKTGGALAMILALLVIFGPEFGIKIPFLSGSGAGENKKAAPKTESKEPLSTNSIPANQSTSNANTNLGEKGVNLKLNISPEGGSTPVIQLNGKSIDPKNLTIPVPLDSPLELTIDKSGYKPLRREFVLNSSQLNGDKEAPIDISLEPIQFGVLTIHTTPSADAIIISDDSSTWRKKTPTEPLKLPIGDYTIRLTNEVLGMEKVVSVKIQDAKNITLDEHLEIKN